MADSHHSSILETPVTAVGARPDDTSLRVLFLDPVGHALASHDRAIGDGLHAAGFDVTVGSSLHEPSDSAYPRIAPYRGVFGDRSRAVKLASFLLARRRILREVRRRGIQIVVLYYVLEPFLDGLLVRHLRKRGVATVVCVHDVLPLRPGFDARGAHGRLYRSADRLLAFGSGPRRQLVEDFGVDPGRVADARFGVAQGPPPSPEGRKEARRRLDLREDEDVVLCLGQVKKNKDVGLLIEAFGRVADRHPGARLYVVGRPWRVDLAPFVRRAEEMGLADRVVFRPAWIAEEDMTAWLRAANLVVLPYRELYQSDVILRACAEGAPIAATDVGNLPDLVRPGNTGWLVPTGDADALGAAVGQALDDPAEATRRGVRAQELVRNEWRWSTFVDRLSQEIRTALSATGHGGGAWRVGGSAAAARPGRGT